MSEYMEKHAVSRLIGAPPGYVGYEEGGLLIDAIRKSPHAVLLLDEIEKAHPDLFSILLQVMDHATLTDSHGRKADFRHVILIMTTNAGARDLSDRQAGVRRAAARAARRAARSSGCSRRSSATASTPPCTFSALGTAEIERVVDKQIDELRAHGRRPRASRSSSTPAARAWLAAKGFDRAFGARPMARLIERVDQEAAVGAAAVLGSRRGHDGDGRRSGRGDPAPDGGLTWRSWSIATSTTAPTLFMTLALRSRTTEMHSVLSALDAAQARRCSRLARALDDIAGVMRPVAAAQGGRS